MSQLPAYHVEAPDQDPDLAEQLLRAQGDGLALVLRDLGSEVAGSLAAQEEALQKVTNALKRRIQTNLRGQVRALIPVMDAIHGSVASSLAEQQAALSILMDQAPTPTAGAAAPPRHFQCFKGTPVQGPDGRMGCLYDGSVHYDDPATGLAAGMWVYDSPATGFPTVPDSVGPSPAPAPPGPAPATTGTPQAVAPPGTYPVPAPAGGTGDQPSAETHSPPSAMCCPPCPAPATSPQATDGTSPSGTVPGAGGFPEEGAPGFSTTGAAGAAPSPPCPAALGYALSDCGLNVWREGASALLSSELVQSMLASPDWRGQLMPGIDGPMGPVPFPAGLDPLDVGGEAADLGYISYGEGG